MYNKVVIEATNVVKKTKKKVRLDGISFTVSSGECIALCGGNGAGKSTLMSMLIGQSKPTSGTIHVFNQEPSLRETAYKKLFSFMPDQAPFSPMMTGYETLLFFAKLQHIPDSRVQELLQLVGLTEAANQRTGTYSKGMKQRLSFAQALLPQAPLLILDEPTNGMDPYWVYRFKEIIQAEKGLGTTILYTSHIMHDVEELADRAAFLNDGKLLAIYEIDSLNEGEKLEELFFQTITRSG